MPQPADLIITNAHIFTANPAQPSAQAIAMQGERIVFVGSSADARAYGWQGPATRVIDAGGRTRDRFTAPAR